MTLNATLSLSQLSGIDVLESVASADIKADGFGCGVCRTVVNIAGSVAGFAGCATAMIFGCGLVGGPIGAITCLVVLGAPVCSAVTAASALGTHVVSDNVCRAVGMCSAAQDAPDFPDDDDGWE